MIRVRFYASLHVAAGERDYRSSARTVGELLREVEERYGDRLGAHLKNCAVAVNGRKIEGLKGARTRLRDGDEVALFPRIVGG